MTLTPYLKSEPVKDERGMVSFTIEFKDADGVVRKNEDFNVDRFSAEWFRQFVRDRTETINFPHEIKAVVAGEIDLSPPVPPAPDVARQAYFNDLVLYRRLKFVGEFRPATLTSAQFTACQTRLRDNFKPEYLDMI